MKRRLILLLMLVFLATPAYGQEFKFAWACDPVPDIDGFKLYIVVPNGTWVTVPYKEITNKGKVVALVEADVEAKIPLNATTRAYLKTYNAQGESEAKVRTFYLQEIELVTSGAARITRQLSWWTP